MNTYNTIVDGFDIELTFEDEQISPVDCYGADYEGIDEICERINDGQDVWVCAKVTASKKGIELASEYLGAVHYAWDKLDNFIKDGYFEDMVNTVVGEAQLKLQDLIAA